MPEYSPMAEDRRPTVRILGFEPNEDKILPVLWGLEEEGLPAELSRVSRENAITLAKQAAQMSPLNVGIGINGVDGKVVLHHRDLPLEQPLFTLGSDAAPMQLRLLGINAARLVKGEPLMLQEETQPKNQDVAPSQGPLGESDEMADLVARVMLELVGKE